MTANRGEKWMGPGYYGRVCEWEQYNGTEIAMVTYLVLNTLQSAVQENLFENVL